MVHAKRQSLRGKRRLPKTDINKSKSSVGKEDEDNDFHRRSSPIFIKRKAQARRLKNIDREFKKLLIY